MTLELALVLFLILCNGFFALSEMSVVASRKPKLRQMAQESRGARVALHLAEHPDNLLSTVQVGIDVAGLETLSAVVSEARFDASPVAPGQAVVLSWKPEDVHALGH